MGRLLLVAVLVAFAVPAIAGADSSSRASADSAAGVSSGAGDEIATAVPMATGSGTVGTGRLGFAGAVALPAGGAHPDQPVVSRRVVVQATRKGDYQVLEIVYR